MTTISWRVGGKISLSSEEEKDYENDSGNKIDPD